MHVDRQIESETSLPRATDIRLKKGPIMASEAISEHQTWKDPLAAPCLLTQSHSRPDQFNFASVGPALPSINEQHSLRSVFLPQSSAA